MLPPRQSNAGHDEVVVPDEVTSLKGRIDDEAGNDLRNALTERVTSSASRRIAGVNGLRREPGTVRSMVGNMLVADTAPKKPARMNDPEYLLSNDGLHGNLTDRSIWAPDSTPQGQRRLRGVRGSGLEIDPTDLSWPETEDRAEYTGVIPEYVAPETVKEVRDYGSVQADDTDDLSNAPMNDPQYRMSGSPGSIPEVDLGRDLQQGSIASPASQRPDLPEPLNAPQPIDPLSFSGYDPNIDYRGLAKSGDLPSPLASLDPQLGYVGDTDMNRAYIDYAIEHGAPDTTLAAMQERGDKWLTLGNDIGRGWRWLTESVPGVLGWFDDVTKAAGNGLHASERENARYNLSDLNTNLADHLVDTAGELPETTFTVLDDGSSYDYEHMTSNFMTGTQYKNYVDAGMGGLPVNEIIPDGIYNKRYEMLYNGFVPFTPSNEAAWKMAVENVVTSPGRMATSSSYLRDIITPDYTITYGPDRRTINGPDFENRASAYISQLSRSDHMDPYGFLSEPDDMTGVTPTIREYAIPDGAGDLAYAHGMLTGASYDDESLYLTFTDGGTIAVPVEMMSSLTDSEGNIVLPTSMVSADNAHGWLPDDLSVLNDMDMIRESAESSGISPLYYAGVQYIPDLIMGDGTTIPYMDVSRLYYDEEPSDNPENAGDDDIEYGFMPFGANIPKRLQQQELFSDEGYNEGFFGGGNALRNAIDWTAGSIPISFEILQPYLTSGSNALMAARGVNAGAYNPYTHSYKLNAGYYDDQGNLRYGVVDRDGNVDAYKSAESILSNTLGTALVPVTENIAGNIGSSPLENALTRAGLYPVLGENPTPGRVLANALAGAAGEGVEEIIGNYFDEFSTYGPSSMYRSPVYNQSGEPMYDVTGREIREADTPAIDRFRNALNPADAANAFFGGVAVSGVMGGGPTVANMVGAARNGAARNDAMPSSHVKPVSLADVEAEARAYDNLANGRPEDYAEAEEEDDNVRYVRMPDSAPSGM